MDTGMYINTDPSCTKTQAWPSAAAAQSMDVSIGPSAAWT